MRRFTLFCIFMIGIWASCSAQLVQAEEADIPEEKVDHSLIIEEALDQAEESLKRSDDEFDLDLDPALLEDSDPAIYEDSDPEAYTEVKVSIELEKKSVPLVHAQPAIVVEMLDRMRSVEGEVYYDQESREIILEDVPERLEVMSAYIEKVDVLVETEVFVLEHVNVEDIIRDVKALLTESVGQVQVSEHANNIVATDTPEKIDKIKKLIKRLDRVDKDVVINSKALQIVLNEEHINGVDWEAIVSNYQNLAFKGFSQKVADDSQNQLNVGTVSKEDYKILLEALDTVGVVDTVLDNTVKTEHSVSKSISLPAASSRGNESLGLESNMDDKIQFHLTPSVKRDGKLNVVVKPEIVKKGRELLGEAEKKTLSVEVKDGHTIVIGSMFKDVSVESMWKVPLLGDIPLLGFVFRNEGRELRKSEIITFITLNTVNKKKLQPHIKKDQD